jgi:hypothetical protein
MSSEIAINAALETLDAMQRELRTLQHALTSSKQRPRRKSSAAAASDNMEHDAAADGVVVDDDDDDDVPISVAKRATAAATGDGAIGKLKKRAIHSRLHRDNYNALMSSEMSRNPQPRDIDIHPLIAYYEPQRAETEPLPLPSKTPVDEHIDVTDALHRTGEQPTHSVAARAQEQQYREQLVALSSGGGGGSDDKNNNNSALVEKLLRQCEFTQQCLLDAQSRAMVERRHFVGLRKSTHPGSM